MIIDRLNDAYLKSRERDGKADTIILSPPDFAAFVKSYHAANPYVTHHPRRCTWRFRNVAILEGNLADDSRIEGRDGNGRFVTVKLEQPANADT